MKQLLTRAIILSRTDYGEADRIITLLTPEQGKIRLMARGVRRMKSKLAGGIELFSTSDITYDKGRGEIGTLISSRLSRYYSNVVKDIGRVQLGYELIKLLNSATEDQPEEDYYHLLEQSFAALDDQKVSLELVRFWFFARLLTLAGYSPNLRTDTIGEPLAATQKYDFNFDETAFKASPERGAFGADHIKFMRLAFSGNQPNILHQVTGSQNYVLALLPILQNMMTAYIQR